MREITEAKYCKFFEIQKPIDEDMECDKCNAFEACMEEPNPYKCKDLIFLRWWTDEIRILGDEPQRFDVDVIPLRSSARKVKT